jgi:predicted  nucleic acid-binding Zn-ribbon protein
MNPNLVRLSELQKIDLQIYELETSSEEFPQKVASLEGELKESEDRLEELQAKLTEIGNEKKAVETAMADAKQSLDRSQTRIASITTNREYDAVHNEIAANEGAVANAETRLTALAEDASNVEQSLAEAKEERDKVQAETGPQVAELKAKIGAIDGQKAELLAKREAVVAEVSKQFIRAYEHIRKRRKDARVLSEVSMADRTCSVCHMVLESQLAAEVRAGKRLNVCQSCGSILIWKTQEEPGGEPDAAG